MFVERKTKADRSVSTVTNRNYTNEEWSSLSAEDKEKVRQLRRNTTGNNSTTHAYYNRGRGGRVHGCGRGGRNFTARTGDFNRLDGVSTSNRFLMLRFYSDHIMFYSTQGTYILFIRGKSLPMYVGYLRYCNSKSERMYIHPLTECSMTKKVHKDHVLLPASLINSVIVTRETLTLLNISTILPLRPLPNPSSHRLSMKMSRDSGVHKNPLTDVSIPTSTADDNHQKRSNGSDR